MEFAMTCNLCGLNEAWTTETAAQAAATWHVYAEHRNTWLSIMGTVFPALHQPEVYGRKYEEWERQG